MQAQEEKKCMKEHGGVKMYVCMSVEILGTKLLIKLFKLYLYY